MQSQDTGALWRGLDRQALDAAYNNSAAVAGSAEIVADWERRSAALRERMPQHLDLRYGERPRNRIDFLSAGGNAPTLVFVHGGYWQMRSKETFTFAAQGPLESGINVALVGHTLAPEATLDEIVAEIRDAIDFLDGRLPALGADPERLWVSGWSAGGHLAAMVLDHPRVRGGLAISGLYDLEPIRRCYVNEKLGLDVQAAKRNSPLLHLPAVSPPLDVFVGGAELAEMRRQSADFAAARRERRLPGEFLEIASANHFTIMEQMASVDGVLTRSIRTMLLGAAHGS
jgi:arylformamidase